MKKTLGMGRKNCRATGEGSPAAIVVAGAGEGNLFSQSDPKRALIDQPIRDLCNYFKSNHLRIKRGQASPGESKWVQVVLDPVTLTDCGPVFASDPRTHVRLAAGTLDPERMFEHRNEPEGFITANHAKYMGKGILAQRRGERGEMLGTRNGITCLSLRPLRLCATGFVLCFFGCGIEQEGTERTEIFWFICLCSGCLNLLPVSIFQPKLGEMRARNFSDFQRISPKGDMGSRTGSGANGGCLTDSRYGGKGASSAEQQACGNAR
jgi:hypothetical protein